MTRYASLTCAILVLSSFEFIGGLPTMGSQRSLAFIQDGIGSVVSGFGHGFKEVTSHAQGVGLNFGVGVNHGSSSSNVQTLQTSSTGIDRGFGNVGSFGQNQIQTSQSSSSSGLNFGVGAGGYAQQNRVQAVSSGVNYVRSGVEGFGQQNQIQTASVSSGVNSAVGFEQQTPVIIQEQLPA